MTRHRPLTTVLAALLVALFALVVVGAAHADVGTVGPVYSAPGKTATAPTGEKPQSKLWFHDGTWWAVMYNATTGNFEIFRRAGSNWTTTGTMVDPRDGSWQDVVWDGNHLQIVSAGNKSTDTGSAVRYSRFGYDSTAKKYVVEIPQQALTSYGVEVSVIDRDSTGTLWVTFTHNSTVYVTHTTTDQSTWVDPYVLPVAGADTISADDISSVVAFNGHIGVMFSDQAAAGSPDAFRWATHVDGDPGDAWKVETAFGGVEMGDDHINLKALANDPAGQVFAAVKTSLNRSTQPMIELLWLDNAGSWHNTTAFTVADGSPTRAQVALDKGRREVYVIASEGPCCTGGAVYMKKASLDDIAFPAGIGTALIQSSTDLKINNVNTPKQAVDASTDLPVLASDDKTHRYWHTLIPLDGTDITPPDTAIVTGPAGTTGSTSAQFSFSSTEPGSTFECNLDNAGFAPCISPVAYGGLGVGDHSFQVRAIDGASNVDPSPASRTWTVASTPSLFTDGFESGDFSLWSTVSSALGGSATVQSDTVGFGAFAARLSATATKGSFAIARKVLSPSLTSLTVLGSLRIDGEGAAGGNVPLLRLYDPSGARVLSLYRPNGSTKLYVGHSGANAATTGRLPSAQFGRFEVDVVTAGTGASTLIVRLNGAQIYSTSTASLGTAGVSTIQLGNDTKSQPFIVYADDMEVR
jgi:hypothetical protein